MEQRNSGFQPTDITSNQSTPEENSDALVTVPVIPGQADILSLEYLNKKTQELIYWFITLEYEFLKDKKKFTDKYNKLIQKNKALETMQEGANEILFNAINEKIKKNNSNLEELSDKLKVTSIILNEIEDNFELIKILFTKELLPYIENWEELYTKKDILINDQYELQQEKYELQQEKHELHQEKYELEKNFYEYENKTNRLNEIPEPIIKKQQEIDTKQQEIDTKQQEIDTIQQEIDKNKIIYIKKSFNNISTTLKNEDILQIYSTQEVDFSFLKIIPYYVEKMNSLLKQELITQEQKEEIKALKNIFDPKDILRENSKDKIDEPHEPDEPDELDTPVYGNLSALLPQVLTNENNNNSGVSRESTRANNIQII